MDSVVKGEEAHPGARVPGQPEAHNSPLSELVLVKLNHQLFMTISLPSHLLFHLFYEETILELL